MTSSQAKREIRFRALSKSGIWYYSDDEAYVLKDIDGLDLTNTNDKHKSTFRGHDIEFKNAVWNYSDTKQPCSDRRECGFCGKSDTVEGHDGCIGTLEGVMNACCGHGVTGEAYVQFASGSRLAGKEALDFINETNERNNKG